jgi:hypothetical protein
MHSRTREAVTVSNLSTLLVPMELPDVQVIHVLPFQYWMR